MTKLPKDQLELQDRIAMLEQQVQTLTQRVEALENELENRLLLLVNRVGRLEVQTGHANQVAETLEAGAREADSAARNVAPVQIAPGYYEDFFEWWINGSKVCENIRFVLMEDDSTVCEVRIEVDGIVTGPVKLNREAMRRIAGAAMAILKLMEGA